MELLGLPKSAIDSGVNSSPIDSSSNISSIFVVFFPVNASSSIFMSSGCFSGTVFPLATGVEFNL